MNAKPPSPSVFQAHFYVFLSTLLHVIFTTSGKSVLLLCF